MIAVFAVLLIVAGSFAQNKPAAEADKSVVVSVQVVLSRYEGDRRTSSLPYTILATADRTRVSVRGGAQVPILTTPTPAADSKQTPPPSFQFVDIGTNVDVVVAPPDNGRFKVEINVQDRSVIDRASNTALRGAPPVASAPTLRNFTYSNAILLRDGETRQFVAASDKVSGDTIRIDVTLKVEN
jgi:hypothetical protein